MTLFNHLSVLLPSIVSPLGITLLLLLLAGLTRRWRGMQSTCLWTGLTVLLVFSLPLTSKTLIASLEDRYPAMPLERIPDADLTILLGGSLNVPDAGLTRPELGPGGDRLALTAALWHAGKTARILISAGGAESPNGVAPEAVHTADVLASWGVPRDVMILEQQSINTWENARFTLQRLAEQDSPGTGVVLLVTSAVHMPRARALFCHAGLETLGVTANHWLNGSTRITLSNWYPSATALRGSSQVIREYLGIAVYAWLDRLDTGVLAHDQPCSASQA